MLQNGYFLVFVFSRKLLSVYYWLPPNSLELKNCDHMNSKQGISSNKKLGFTATEWKVPFLIYRLSVHCI
jgi:hypothetical protein